MDDLSTWLVAQIAEDEQLATAATPGPWQGDVDGVDQVALSPDYIARYRCVNWVDGDTEDILAVNGEHIAAWDPARVLAECETKRRVIKLYQNAVHAHRAGSVSNRNRTQDEAAVDVLGAVVEEYGVMYAKLGRPGYQESWRPAA